MVLSLSTDIEERDEIAITTFEIMIDIFEKVNNGSSISTDNNILI